MNSKHRFFTLQNKARCGENYAKLYYEKLGYILLVQNFRCLGSEIDLIFEKEKTLVFVEVKLRKQSMLKAGIDPCSLISHKKKKSLMTGAESFLQKYEDLVYDAYYFDLCLLGYQYKNNFLKVVSMISYKDFLSRLE